jgi:hypothetical protein
MAQPVMMTGSLGRLAEAITGQGWCDQAAQGAVEEFHVSKKDISDDDTPCCQ